MGRLTATSSIFAFTIVAFATLTLVGAPSPPILKPP